MNRSFDEAVFHRLLENIGEPVSLQESSNETLFQILQANIDEPVLPQESPGEALLQIIRANIDALVPPQELVKPGVCFSRHSNRSYVLRYRLRRYMVVAYLKGSTVRGLPLMTRKTRTWCSLSDKTAHTCQWKRPWRKIIRA